MSVFIVLNQLFIYFSQTNTEKIQNTI